MSKKSNVKIMLPAAVERSLVLLGENLRIARKRRKQSLASWAERLQVSIPTLQKMEAGEPSVSVATYATALWLVGKVQALIELSSPEKDEVALLQELKKISKPRSQKS